MGFTTGKILPDGSADNPDLPKYRVFKIRKDWESLPQGPARDAYEKDYNEWPIEDGAPWDDVDGNGIYSEEIDRPLFIGDETLYYVTNDLDTARSIFTYGSLPIGLEFQTLVYGFDTTNYLKNVVFKRYLIINKGINTIDSLYFGYWSDSDLGIADDDAFGCDTLLQMGFTYNGKPDDYDYAIPPAVGHMLLHGPIVQGSANDSARFMGKWHWGVKNLGMSVFSGQFEWDDFWHPWHGVYEGTKQYYNFMTGYTRSGIPFTDPFTEKITKFLIPGDPVLGSEGGWHYLNWPLKTFRSPSPMDIQLLVTTGPITMAPGDSQEVEIAILIAVGEDYLDSITKLKELAWQTHQYFGNDIPTDIKNTETILPNEYHLFKNYPNPFNPSTTIKFTIPFKESVKLEVFNIAGQKVRTLMNRKMQSGYHQVEFNASDLASGIYFYKIQAGKFQDVKKMMLIK